MHPIFFELGSFSIRWYGVMAAIGFLAAVWFANVNRRFAKLSADQATSLVFVAIVSGVIGARIFFVVQFFHLFRNDLWSIVRIDRGGLVFYGGFFLALAALFVYCLKNHLDTIRVFDILVPSLTLGHFFGRIGCILNGCCFGSPSDWFCAVKYPLYSEAYYRFGNVALHPVQLYEAAMNLVLFGVTMYLLRHSRRGVVMSTYIIGYGLMRFANEFFRGDHSDRLFGLFTPAQTIGLLMMPLGAALLIYFLRKKDTNAEKTA